VLAAHPDLLVERSELPVLEARQDAASTLLPSNPVLAVSGSQRRASESTGRTALEWSASLSQELELAGGRGRRMRAADAELAAGQERLRTSERVAVAAGWAAYFRLLAARAELELSERLLAASERMSRVARGKAEKGLLAAVEADVVSSSTLQVLRAKLDAERALAAARAELSYVLARDPGAPELIVEGALEPLAVSDASSLSAAALAAAPELRALSAERTALGERAAALRRERVPNPTLSLFAARDGFDERVLGVGLSIPIPLPSPLGQTRAGEIAELEAQARRVQQRRRQAEARAQRSLTLATAALRSHRQFVEALPPAALERAEQSLRNLGVELEAGRVTVREALNAQLSLVELLRSHIAERRALCLASIDLALAQGVPLEKAPP
jgi:cobalt-zinc-cadmium efflux system outer membrane protein